MIRLINHGTGDKNIKGMYLDLSFLQQASLGALQELAQALEDFKSRGKIIIAWASGYSQAAWYLAACADRIYMDPMGQVLLPGLGIYRFYYKEASYGEAFVRSSMSENMKKENRRWLNNLWGQYLEEAARRRNLDPIEVAEWIRHYPLACAGEGMRAGQAALEGKLIDGFADGEERQAILHRYFGGASDAMVEAEEYTSLLENENPGTHPNIMVLTLAGEIHEGPSRPYSIGSDSAIEALDTIASDSSVRALVLRLDTGGGSAYASELIRRKLLSLKKQGIHILVSMGGVTASGGYWIATAGDEIWADPGCITGSIGVFTLIPRLEKFTRETLHLNPDGVGTTWMSPQKFGGLDPDPRTLALFQTSVDDTYNQFLTLVGQSRGMGRAQLLPLAEGRVWSGLEAEENGLADHVGSLDDVVRAAADRAGLDQWNTLYYRESLPAPRDMIRQALSLTRGPSSLEKTLVRLFAPVKDFIPKPGQVYALWTP